MNKLLTKAAISMESGKVISGVECEVVLPKLRHEKPSISLRVNADEYNILQSVYEAELQATIKQNDKIIKKISTPELNIVSRKGTFWGDDSTDYEIKCIPEHLQIIDYIFSDSVDGKTSIYFWINDNHYIAPTALVSPLKNNGIAIEVLEDKVFNFLGHKISVGLVIRNEKCDEQCFRLTRAVHAKVLTDVDPEDTRSIIRKYLVDIDAFLLLTSFASSNQTRCSGWLAEGSQALVHYYRGRYELLQDEPQSRFCGIIEILDFPLFISLAQPALSNKTERNIILQAITIAINAREMTLETQFIKLFSAFESLVNYNAEKNSHVYAIEKKDWDGLKYQLQATIKLHLNTKSSRKLMYEKLEEINRVSLKSSYEKYCTNSSFKHGELWPLNSSKEFIGLSGIRNYLVHGASINGEFIELTCIAIFHLECLLQRVILQSLGWDINKSKVSPNSWKFEHQSVLNWETPAKQMKVILDGMNAC